MKLLVATTRTQGWRKNDFCYVPEGEIVTFTGQCDNAETDDRCGCARAMTGTLTRKATTTMMVADLPLDTAGLAGILQESDRRAGFSSSAEDVEAWAKFIETFCKELEPGTIVEFRDDALQVRPLDA